MIYKRETAIILNFSKGVERMCEVLKEIYRKIYKESFVYEELDKRIKLQKAVYLLENMGVHVGDYSFSWNKYGPYSLALDSDAKICSTRDEQEVIFSSFAEERFGRVRNYIEKQIGYDLVRWMECIASLLYLKNVFRFKESTLIHELESRKPYLANEEANKKALSILKEIKVGA